MVKVSLEAHGKKLGSAEVTAIPTLVQKLLNSSKARRRTLKEGDMLRVSCEGHSAHLKFSKNEKNFLEELTASLREIAPLVGVPASLTTNQVISI